MCQGSDMFAFFLKMFFHLSKKKWSLQAICFQLWDVNSSVAAFKELPELFTKQIFWIFFCFKSGDT